jgi:hypothetical protein
MTRGYRTRTARPGTSFLTWFEAELLTFLRVTRG